MYSAHVTEVAIFKEDLLKGLEFINWKNQVKMDSTMFLKPDYTFLITKKGLLHRLNYYRHYWKYLKTERIM
jgi:hypothetical protein